MAAALRPLSIYGMLKCFFIRIYMIVPDTRHSFIVTIVAVLLGIFVLVTSE